MEKRKTSNYVAKEPPKTMARIQSHTRDHLIHDGKTYLKLSPMSRPVEIISGLSKRKAQLWMCIEVEATSLPQIPAVVPEFL